MVGIGGSAGSFEAFRAILAALDAKTGMAFVFVLHLAPDRVSAAAKVLSQWTPMPVEQADDGVSFRANHVYVIPPNCDLLVRGDHFITTTPRTMSSRHHQVDIFLKSLAAFGPRAIAVILSGGDGDGTEGCQEVKLAGGHTFAQDASAKIDSMPRHAAASGSVDDVLSPAQIAAELNAISRTSRRTAA